MAAATHATLLVSQRAISLGNLLPMDKCIEAMRDVLTSGGDMPLRSVIFPSGVAGGHASMPAFVRLPEGAFFGLKSICIFAGNQYPIDPHQGVVLLHAADEGGRLACIADASSVTEIRTAAVSGVATDALALRAASVLAILGTGIQAGAHVSACLSVRPGIRTVRLWGRTSTKVAALRERLMALHPTLAFEACDSAQAAVAGAHIICTLCHSSEAVLQGAWVAPGAHINAVGACTPRARELDGACMARARLIVDSRLSTLAESGDYLQALAEGAIKDDHIAAELGQVLRGEQSGRIFDDQITLFKSHGLAIEDVAAVALIYKKLRAMPSLPPLVTALGLGGVHE